MSSPWISSGRNSRALRAGLAGALFLSAAGVTAQPRPTSPDDRFLQGAPAEASRYPYVAALSRGPAGRRVYFCAGTLIAPQWIATAAHCFHTPDGRRIDARDMWVEVGRDALSDVPEEAQVRVDRIVVHPGYDPGGQGNDIALVHLAEIAGPLVAEIARRSDGAGRATALGFGSLYEGSLSSSATTRAGDPAAQTSDRLRQAAQELRDPSYCAILPGDNPMAPTIVCAGADPHDACVGDSGGPLVEQDDEGTDRLIGILSRGSGCAVPAPVAAYTRVSAYAGWIAATVAAP